MQTLLLVAMPLLAEVLGPVHFWSHRVTLVLLPQLKYMYTPKLEAGVAGYESSQECSDWLGPKTSARLKWSSWRAKLRDQWILYRFERIDRGLFLCNVRVSITKIATNLSLECASWQCYNGTLISEIGSNMTNPPSYFSYMLWRQTIRPTKFNASTQVFKLGRY